VIWITCPECGIPWATESPGLDPDPPDRAEAVCPQCTEEFYPTELELP